MADYVIKSSKYGQAQGKKDILSMTLPELEKETEALGEKKFRAKQIFSWLHEHSVQSFDEMTNISKSLRDKLESGCAILHTSIEKKLCSEYDNTKKYLLKLDDGEYIESVLMRYKYGQTVCVSTVLPFSHKSRLTSCPSRYIGKLNSIDFKGISDSPLGYI